MSQRSSPGAPRVGGDTTPQAGSGFNLISEDDYLFGQDPDLLDEFLRNHAYEFPYPVGPELDNGEHVEQYTSSGYIDPGISGGNVGNYIPESFIDPRLLGLGGLDGAASPEIPSDLDLQETGHAPERYGLEVEGPYQPLYDLDGYLKAEVENTRPEIPATGRVSDPAISTQSPPPHLPRPGTPSEGKSSPRPAADSPPKRRTRSPSEIDHPPTPAASNPELGQQPTDGDQPVTKSLHPPARATPAVELADVGCALVVQKIKDSGVEVPIVYTIYLPLKNWGAFRYTRRGDLHQDITFDEKSLHDFIYKHPMQQNLTLRIERHPYGFQCRYRNTPYMKCRAKKCSVDKMKSFKVGDFRIAVDEVTGRLGANQFNDNDPYFSACFFHLQCFEELTYIPDLVTRNMVVVDDRGVHIKEPECTRINKMGVAPATVVAFNKWRETALEKMSEGAHWQPSGKDTLTAAIWLSSIRKGRKRGRAPPGITSDDIERRCSTHPGWGGKRVSGLSVADMREMELQGRSSEMIASRNGKTGKRGVKEPELITKKRLLSKAEEKSENSLAPAGPPIYDSITVAGSSPVDNPTKNTLEAESPTCGEGAGYPPAKRRRLAPKTPENPPAAFGHNATSAPRLAIPENYDGDIGDFLNSPYDGNYHPNYNLPPNYYPPATYHGLQAQYYGPQTQYHGSPTTNHDFPVTNLGLQATYYGYPGSCYSPKGTKLEYNALATNPSLPDTPHAPTETCGIRFGEGGSSEEEINAAEPGEDSDWWGKNFPFVP